MPKWTTNKLGNMAGRTVLVTGASSGIGLVAAREFAGAGARVVMAVRNTEKGQQAAADLAGTTEVRQLDVSSLRSVRQFAQDWTGPIDILVNNAGIMDIPLTRSVDGLELQTATNYVGPFLLTNLLLPHITGRIVSVSSQLHRLGRIRLDDLNWNKRRYRSWAAYETSKLELGLFSLELQARLDGQGNGVRSVLAHPGIAVTNLVAHSSSAGIFYGMSFMMNDAEKGALPTLFAASEDVAGNAYVGPDGFGSIKGHPTVRKQSRKALDAKLAAHLWTATEQLIASHS